jgi:Cd2+/Zn2+-exporting ATPase
MSTYCESTKPENCQSVSCCSAATNAPTALSEQDAAQIRLDQPQNKFRIANMDCASEEAEIRHALDGIQGVDALRFDLGARVLTISASGAVLPDALEAIRNAGFKPEPIEEDVDTPSGTTSAFKAFWQVWGKLFAALCLAFAAEAIAYGFPATTWIKVLGMGLAIGAILLSGFSVYGKGLAALRQRRLNINALMTVAVTGAFLIGQWPEAAMVMALYAIAEAIEARAVDRARGAIKSLLALSCLLYTSDAADE